MANVGKAVKKGKKLASKAAKSEVGKTVARKEIEVLSETLSKIARQLKIKSKKIK